MQKNKIIISSSLIASLLLTGCSSDEKKQPSDIKIDTSTTTETPTIEVPTTETPKENKIIKKANKQEKVNVDEVVKIVESMHNFSADEPNLYNDFKNKLKEQNVTIEGDLSKPYEVYDPNARLVKIGYFLNSNVTNKDKSVININISTINANITFGREDTAKIGNAKARSMIKNNPQKQDMSQTVHYKLTLNKDKSKGVLTLDPKDKNWYKRTNN